MDVTTASAPNKLDVEDSSNVQLDTDDGDALETDDVDPVVPWERPGFIVACRRSPNYCSWILTLIVLLMVIL